MAWDFATDPQYQQELEWVDAFVRDEVEPLDYVFKTPYDLTDTAMVAATKPLQQQVKERKLWACHLGPELGGQGFGQLKLALLNEILGRSAFAPRVFGCQAPDSGNAEILAHYGTAGQKEKWLQPLLDGDIVSCYSMTEPHGGADPTGFRTTAARDGDEWVINGYKWFSSNARYATFFITQVVTNTDVSAYNGQSMFIVPADTPGINILRNVAVGEPDEEGSHAYIHYDNVRVPIDHLLGGEGQGFNIAQTRLGGGRVHHAMRTVASVRKAFDMMCERALSRTTKGELLGKLQMTQEKIADSWVQMEMFRLLVLRTAWKIDQEKDYLKVRKDIAAVKMAMPEVLHDVVQRAMQLHGSLGVSNDLPFARMWLGAVALGLADGPTEVHKVTLARQVLRDYKAGHELWPSEHVPTKRAAAIKKLGHLLEREVATQ